MRIRWEDQNLRRRVVRILVLSAGMACAGSVGSIAQPVAVTSSSSAAIEHLFYRYGPLTVIPGQNLIQIGPDLQKPAEDGYIVGGQPSLELANGTVPPVTEIHLHHGVWLNTSRLDATDPALPERFFASGEEKTYFHLPAGYGYPYRPSDVWLMNYMIHNLTPNPQSVYITYYLDFVPASSPLARTIHPAYPIWMDVRNGEAYPVFDAVRSLSHNGVFVYPDDVPGAYAHSGTLNEWTVDRPGTLIATAGHLHPGGIYDQLDLIRAGATIAHPAGTRCVRRGRRHRAHGRQHRHGRHHARGRLAGKRARRLEHRARRRHERHRRLRCAAVSGPIPGSVPNSVRLFRSEAVNYDPNGRVSWDFSMTATDPQWRVQVRPGDVLRISTAYDTSQSSWYESMGIMVVWIAYGDSSGVDPFTTAVPTTGQVTHGSLPENHYGGGASQGLPDPATLPGSSSANMVQIANFTFLPGGQTLSGPLGEVPTIHVGQRLTFINEDAASGVYHTVTACRQPCTASYGASYPLANGGADFDSGELGYGPPGFTPAAQRVTWSTPTYLPPGTYTFFCRIHPWMRGAFRVIQ